MFGSLSALALAAALLVESAVHGEPVEDVYVLLFTGQGSSSAGENKWDGWYRSGLTVDSGDGKRPAYDNEPMEALTFWDDSGRWATYKLFDSYSGWTLLDIVKHCMGEDRANDGSEMWNVGHCRIGELLNSHDITGVSATLRIGVGDGMGDADDWGLFMLEANATSDFAGLNAYCFGSEGETNTGHTGQVSITGHVKVTTTVTTTAFGASGKSQALLVRISISGYLDGFKSGIVDHMISSAQALLADRVQAVCDTAEVIVASSSPVGAFSFILDFLVECGPEGRLPLQASINSLRDTLDPDFTQPLNLAVQGLRERPDAILTADLHTADTEVSGQPKAEETSPWADAGAAEGNPYAAAMVVGSSVFLTACPFVCASLWCFCRQNRQGASGNNSKGTKKGNGIEAESDIISMIEEMGDAPCHLPVQDPVCVTLSGSDPLTDPRESGWRQK